MPTPAGDPLRKVTLNLYEEDCQILERVYGRGWTTEVRDDVHIVAQATNKAYNKRTLASLQESTK